MLYDRFNLSNYCNNYPFLCWNKKRSKWVCLSDWETSPHPRRQHQCHRQSVMSIRTRMLRLGTENSHVNQMSLWSLSVMSRKPPCKCGGTYHRRYVMIPAWCRFNKCSRNTITCMVRPVAKHSWNSFRFHNINHLNLDLIMQSHIWTWKSFICNLTPGQLDSARSRIFDFDELYTYLIIIISATWTSTLSFLHSKTNFIMKIKSKRES